MKSIENFQLGDCLINPLESTIVLADGEKKSLQPKFIEVLTYLAKQYPRLVGRDELIEKIWQDNQPVGEKALTNAIWHLRKNLKNDDTEVIETIRKVGYRLLVEPVWQQPTIVEEVQQLIEPMQLNRASQSWQRNNWFIVCGAVVIVMVMMMWFGSPSIGLKPDVLLNKPQITQITTSPGSELFVTTTTDGRYIAYRWRNADGKVDLYMKDTHQLQSPPVQLTADDFRQGHSVFSPDGQYLYFSRKSRKKGICQMIKMSVSTLQQQVIADCPISGGYYYVDISPDGQTLALQGEENGISGIYFLSVGDSKPGEMRRFSCLEDCDHRERDMAFSPDGQTLAVTRRFNRFNENIYLVDIATGQSQVLTTGEEDIVGLAWHPNGEQLVFATQIADVRRGFVIDINTKQRQPLDIAGFSYPAFAKDTGELFFQQRKEHYFISRYSLEAQVVSAPFPLLQSQFNHHYPDYSPVSRRLVYVSNESGFYELWLADVNGAQRTQLTHLQTSIRYPRWSHDGGKIAFLAPVVGKTGDKIHIIDIASAQVSVVDSPFEVHNLPTWRLDDSRVISAVYDNEFTDLYQFDIATGKAERLTYDGGRFGVDSPQFGLVYTKVRSGLWAKRWESKTSGEALIAAESFNSRYSWRLSENGVYYQHHGDDYQQLMFFDFANNQSKVLLRLANYSLKDDGALSVLLDSKQLFFTQAHHPQADIQRVVHPLLMR